MEYFTFVQYMIMKNSVYTLIKKQDKGNVYRNVNISDLNNLALPSFEVIYWLFHIHTGFYLYYKV